MKDHKSFPETVTGLRDKGYTTDFSLDTFCLYCGDLDIRLNPEQFSVDEEYRFEGDAAHDEDTIVAAITSSNGVKGILVDSYNSYSENANQQSMGSETHKVANDAITMSQ